MPRKRITRFFDMSREMFARFFGMSREVFPRASSGKKLRVKKVLFGKFAGFCASAWDMGALRHVFIKSQRLDVNE